MIDELSNQNQIMKKIAMLLTFAVMFSFIACNTPPEKKTEECTKDIVDDQIDTVAVTDTIAGE